MHEELKMKYGSLESKSESSSDKSFPCNIPCAIPIIKVDASSYLRWLKGKYTQEQVQPSQDNTSAGMKKLEKGETVTFFKCYKEGHKSYQCKKKEGQAKGKENSKPKNLNKSKKGHKKAKEIKKNTSPNLKASYMYTKPTHKNKQKSNHYHYKKSCSP